MIFCLFNYRDPTAGFSIRKYPILGRDDEMRLFLKLVLDCYHMFNLKLENIHGGLKMLTHHNCLILSGEARQGKGRLLEELVYINPKTIPIVKIKVKAVDYKVLN